MDNAGKHHRVARAAIAWRMAAIVQGIAIAGAAGAGAFWAFTMDREGSASPEPAALARPVEPMVPAASDEVPPGWLYYIVGSEEEAAALRRAIAEGNNIRHELGLDLLREDVLVAADVAESLRLQAALLEGSRILAGFNVADRVINLVA